MAPTVEIRTTSTMSTFRLLVSKPQSYNAEFELNANDTMVLDSKVTAYKLKSKCFYKSHPGTVVPECFKDDSESQWKSIKDWEI